MEGSPRVTICGFGSLMSQASAQRTFPSLRNFRTGKVAGFARVFRLVSVSCILHGYSNPARKEYATCAAARREDSHLLVALFDVDPDELPAFFEREHRLRIVEVDYEEYPPDSAPPAARTGRALLCTEYSDEEYIAEKCGGSQDEYRRRVGRLYTGRLWRNDILPARFYLSLCLCAARSLGEEFVDNFLEASFLGDGETSVRDYLAATAGVLHPLTFAVDDEEMERIRQCQTKRTVEEARRDNYAVQMSETSGPAP